MNSGLNFIHLINFFLPKKKKNSVKSPQISNKCYPGNLVFFFFAVQLHNNTQAMVFPHTIFLCARFYRLRLIIIPITVQIAKLGQDSK